VSAQCREESKILSKIVFLVGIYRMKTLNFMTAVVSSSAILAIAL
jgi:hypothetical protein